MPQFMLNRSAYEKGDEPGVRTPHPFYSLNEFARGYVEAMFFTNGDTGDEREFLLNEWGVERLTKESVDLIRLACGKFERQHASLLAEAYQREDYGAAQAGRDLWFTSQGHGVGYWDRRQLEPQGEEWAETQIPLDQWTPEIRVARQRIEAESIGNRLTDAAKRFGESNVEAYRGWIYYR